MGYQIMYSPEDNHKYPPYKPAKKKWLLPVVITLALLIAAGRPQTRRKLEQWFIPGDVQTTKAAFSVLMDDIREGEPVNEAVAAFCNVIIAGGKAESIQDT